MRNKILLLTIFCLALFLQHSMGQHLMDLKVKKLSGDSLPLSSLGGKKMLFLLLPLSSGDSVLSQLDSFVSRYGDTVQVVGIFSYEDGYTAGLKSTVTSIYQSRPILLLDGMYTKKTSPEQSPLFQWLTRKERNRHFDNDAMGVGQKFFVDQTARLYAVLPVQVSLQSIVIGKVVHSNPRPLPGSGSNFP